MKSKLFEQVLEECHFADLPSMYDDTMENTSKSVGFHYKKVGKDLFEISCEKDKTKKILSLFPEAETRDLVEGQDFDKFKLKFNVIN